MLRRQARRILFGLLTSILLLTQTFPFDIQPVEALGPYQVATGTNKLSTAWENQRKLAMESDGTIHAVYFRTDGGGICQIYHAYSSDDGITWVEEQVTSASRDQVYTALAVDSQDNLHFVWQDGDEGKMGSGGNPVTYYRCKNKQTGWQAAEFVSSYATYPSIALDSNDDVHVVYGTFVYSGYYGGGNGIRWKKKTISGWQTEESLSSNKYWTRDPAIAIDGNDDIHVAWDNAPRALYYDINYRKRTASGWGTEVQVNTELDNRTGCNPSIIVDGNNYVHIVWERKTAGNYSIRYRAYTTSWQTPVDIEGPTAYDEGAPVIAIDNLGHIHVAWAGQHSDSPTLTQIRHREYTGSWQPVQNLTSSASDNQTYPSLLWARYPTTGGVPTNQPENGYSLIWNDGTIIRFYSGTDPVVTFPDANLEAAIREAISKPTGDIYASELAGLTSLNADVRGIANLAGLEYCTSLQGLSLAENQISDLTPLRGLTSLTGLNLGYNQISDITPLVGLTNITSLNLNSNQISDISSLAGLTNLEKLYLDRNFIINLTPLAGLTNLEELLMDHNQISDLTPLAGLISLIELSIMSNHITDITPLAGLTSLETLWLENNQITDITPLAGLTSLTYLDLMSNQITGITPLAGLTSLTTLMLYSNQITDITPLAGLTNLTTLLLDDNQISDISPLVSLTNLTWLSLGTNQISNISSLAGLTNLTGLILDYNQISNLSSLAGLTNLTGLFLGSNQITDISPLAGLGNLTTLTLDSNQISNLMPLTGLTNLKYLLLHSNQISDISALSALNNIELLLLNDNSVVDITSLSGLTKLGESPFVELGVHLGLRNNQISDINPLVENAGLSEGDRVDLRGNPLSPISVNVYIPALQTRSVIVFWDDVVPATITLAANPKSITANGSSTSTITATVKDDEGNNVPDGTTVTFTTSAGSIGSTTTTKPTTNGVATATLTSSRTDGVATVTATSGDASAATAVFFTRPGLTVTDYVEEETPPGQYTVDAKSMGDIEVIKSGDGTTTITVAKYSGNPAGPNPGGFSAAGDYVDVHLTSTDNVTQIEIRKYYTADEIRGMREQTLRMRWWSGSGWVECSNSGVNTNDVNGYSGYVWAIITDDTIPCLADLAGAMFVAMGPATITPPSPTANQVSPATNPLKTALISVQYLSISPQNTSANKPVIITTNVVNTGGQAGNLSVTLKINGKVEQTKMVSVGPQGTQPVKFTVTKAQPGTYTVDVGGQKSSFTILGTGSGTAGTNSTDRVIGILFIIGALVLFAVLVIWLVMRRTA